MPLTELTAASGRIESLQHILNQYDVLGKDKRCFTCISRNFYLHSTLMVDRSTIL